MKSSQRWNALITSTKNSRWNESEWSGIIEQGPQLTSAHSLVYKQWLLAWTSLSLEAHHRVTMLLGTEATEQRTTKRITLGRVQYVKNMY